eukprot:6220598-Pyramimonas_sp.AAC.1
MLKKAPMIAPERPNRAQEWAHGRRQSSILTPCGPHHAIADLRKSPTRAPSRYPPAKAHVKR